MQAAVPSRELTDITGRLVPSQKIKKGDMNCNSFLKLMMPSRLISNYFFEECQLQSASSHLH
jgi:hypothetical protein